MSPRIHTQFESIKGVCHPVIFIYSNVSDRPHVRVFVDSYVDVFVAALGSLAGGTLLLVPFGHHSVYVYSYLSSMFVMFVFTVARFEPQMLFLQAYNLLRVW